MPFTGRAIDPNDLEFMRAAFNKVCDQLGLRCSREDPLTELVVDTIIEIVATGERDSDRLYEGVVERLTCARGQEAAERTLSLGAVTGLDQGQEPRQPCDGPGARS
jgi:hypothetical protein